jgi:hypothetical protein
VNAASPQRAGTHEQAWARPASLTKYVLALVPVVRWCKRAAAAAGGHAGGAQPDPAAGTASYARAAGHRGLLLRSVRMRSRLPASSWPVATGRYRACTCTANSFSKLGFS